jgi:hypothetical protein
VGDEISNGCQHTLVPLAEQGCEKVLAELVPPEVVAAITPRHPGRVQVDPVGLLAAANMVAAGTHPVDVELETPLEALEVDTAQRDEVDSRLGHGRNLA